MTMPAAATRSWRRWILGRLKLSVRSLMLVVAIVGGGVGWIGHRVRTQRHIADAVVRCGGHVAYHDFCSWSRHPSRKIPPSSLFWRLYGEWFEGVTFVGLDRNMKVDRGVRLAALSTFTGLSALGAEDVELTEAELVAISNRGRLSYIDLEGTGIDDAGLAHLAGLGQLRWLSLRGARITDAGLAHLTGLSRLTVLDLSDTRVTDAGVVHLVKLPALRGLLLHSTAVSIKGLRALGQLPNLRNLVIPSTSVSDEEIAALQLVFPSLHIEPGSSR
jgi:hypothetical protein